MKMLELALVNYQLNYLLRVLIAGLCGALIGVERTRSHKDAGIRTHFVVCAASCLMTCVSMFFSDIGHDGGRITAQIVTGVSFLGAGVIFFRRETLHGLTTAAGIWGTAGIGMACGVGLYVLAFGSTLVLFLLQLVFHINTFSRKHPRLILIKFVFSNEAVTNIKQIFKIKKFERYKATLKEGEIHSEGVVRTFEKCIVEDISMLLESESGIYYIERLED